MAREVHPWAVVDARYICLNTTEHVRRCQRSDRAVVGDYTLTTMKIDCLVTASGGCRGMEGQGQIYATRGWTRSKQHSITMPVSTFKPCSCPQGTIVVVETNVVPDVLLTVSYVLPCIPQVNCGDITG